MISGQSEINVIAIGDCKRILAGLIVERFTQATLCHAQPMATFSIIISSRFREARLRSVVHGY
jgi:hypothetical protein